MKLSFIEQLKNVVKGLKDVPLEDGQMLVASVPREELANTPLGLKKDVPPVPTPPPVAPVSDVPVTHTPLSDGPFASSPNADTVSDQSREMNLDMIDEEEDDESLYGGLVKKSYTQKTNKRNTEEKEDKPKKKKGRVEKSVNTPVAPGSPEGVLLEEQSVPQLPKTQEQNNISTTLDTESLFNSEHIASVPDQNPHISRMQFTTEDPNLLSLDKGLIEKRRRRKNKKIKNNRRDQLTNNILPVTSSEQLIQDTLKRKNFMMGKLKNKKTPEKEVKTRVSQEKEENQNTEPLTTEAVLEGTTKNGKKKSQEHIPSVEGYLNSIITSLKQEVVDLKQRQDPLKKDIQEEIFSKEEMIKTLEKERDFKFGVAQDKNFSSESSHNNTATPSEQPKAPEELSAKEEIDRLANIRSEHEARSQALQEEENQNTEPLTTETVSETARENAIPPIPESIEQSEPENIEGLRTIVAEMRERWVETDFRNTTAWNKLKNVLGIQRGKHKDDAQVYYEEAVRKLRDAEVAVLQRRFTEGQLSSEEREREMARLMRYYKLEESTNLIIARTHYKAEHQTFSEKIMDSLGVLGRAYNRVPLKTKLAITAAFLGATTVTVFSGGSGTAVGALAFLSVVRKVVSGAGMAVGTEALLESFGERKRTSHAEEEIQNQIENLKTQNLGRSSESTFASLNTMLDGDINTLNTKLQNEKRAKTWRKMSALGIGGLVGSGWATQIVMNELGGNQAVDWVKDHVGGTAVESAPQTADIASVPRPDVLSNMLNQDYVVQKGDSVWKIAGRIADTMQLEGAQRTHFIDALKDQYGDVQLKEGATLNFASHGIDKTFVENALSHAHNLTPDQIASISANDTKIAEFVASHPGTTLDNATVEKILHDTMEVQQDSVTLSDGTTFPVAENIPNEMSQTGGESPVSTSAVETSTSGPVFTPELAPRVDDWYMQIFRVENPSSGQDWIVDKDKIGAIQLRDLFQDAKLYQEGSLTGYTTGLNREQVMNFTQFLESVDEKKLFDRKLFLQENRMPTVMDYLKKVAPLATRGTRFGLYTTTN